VSRWADLFTALSGGYDTVDPVRHNEDAPALVSHCVHSVNASEGREGRKGEPAGGLVEHNLGARWPEIDEERAAIIEYEAGVPRAWAEGFARLDPERPPGDVPLERWLAFIDDCGRFLDGGFAGTAAALGWGPSDLFGCDRERPFARIERAGLLWRLNGARLVALTAETAVIETRPGVQQTYRRRPIAPGRVLARELAL
jgi:hypothetical protein